MSDCEKLARFLRARAERLRRIAMMHDAPFSERLLDVAGDFEGQAEALGDKLDASALDER